MLRLLTRGTFDGIFSEREEESLSKDDSPSPALEHSLRGRSWEVGPCWTKQIAPADEPAALREGGSIEALMDEWRLRSSAFDGGFWEEVMSSPLSGSISELLSQPWDGKIK